MANPSNNALLAWALGATIVAVGAVGYILGKQAGGGARERVAPASAATTTEPGADARTALPAYQVPDAFEGIATEWRTVVDNSLSGHSVLFDPDRRRFIAERCEHHGYASAAAVDAAIAPCKTLLKGTLNSLATDQATLLSRSGDPVSVKLSLDQDNDTPSLRLRFDDHDIRLVPGRRNDLMQDIEALPQVQKNKHEYFVAIMQGRPDRDNTDAERQ